LLEIYFIRHGQSENNVLMDETGREDYLSHRSPDPDLTDWGREQAVITANILSQPYQGTERDPQNRSGFGLTHLYCSLMIRAVKTGVTISEVLGLPLVAWPDVHEIGGVFDVRMEDGQPVFIGQPGPGKSFFQKEFPSLVIPEDLSEEGWWAREKEPRESYLVRARRIIDRLNDQHGGKAHRVGVVMHGGIFYSILTALFDVKAAHYWFLMNNCGISRVDISDDGFTKLVYMNKVDHLPDHLIT